VKTGNLTVGLKGAGGKKLAVPVHEAGVKKIPVSSEWTWLWK